MKKEFLDHDFKTTSLCSKCSSCVAVAHKDGTIAVRDTKDASKNTLQFTSDEWQAFIAGVKNGEFDF
jgi:hypothetical protein